MRSTVVIRALGLSITLASIVGAYPLQAAQESGPAPTAELPLSVVLERLAEPCSGIQAIALENGINPRGMGQTLRDRFLLARAHIVLLPVLVELATTPGLADEATTLAQRLRDQFQRTAQGELSLFGDEQARDAWRAIYDAAQRGAEGRQAVRDALAAGVAPPAVSTSEFWMATLRDTPQLWQRWESAALLGQAGYRCPGS